jgi:hypothetical protein
MVTDGATGIAPAAMHAAVEAARRLAPTLYAGADAAVAAATKTAARGGSDLLRRGAAGMQLGATADAGSVLNAASLGDLGTQLISASNVVRVPEGGGIGKSTKAVKASSGGAAGSAGTSAMDVDA